MLGSISAFIILLSADLDLSYFTFPSVYQENPYAGNHKCLTLFSYYFVVSQWDIWNNKLLFLYEDMPDN